jgi:hypothetical protein
MCAGKERRTRSAPERKTFCFPTFSYKQFVHKKLNIAPGVSFTQERSPKGNADIKYSVS